MICMRLRARPAWLPAAPDRRFSARSCRCHACGHPGSGHDQRSSRGPSPAAGAHIRYPASPDPARVTKVVRAGGGWWDPGWPVRGSELRDDLAGGGAGFGAGVCDRDRCRHLRGTVGVAAGRRDRHGCLQCDASMLAAHRTAVDEPAAIWLGLGHGYAWPAGLKMRRESTAIARWPDHDASVALPPPKGAPTRGVLMATRTGRPPR
jgi:hypothetical protein